jgi:hypothetical protein
MSKLAFRISVAGLLTTMVVLFFSIGIMSPGFQAMIKPSSPPAFGSPEWMKDFMHKIYYYCDHRPIGHPDRPADHLCSAPRR